MLAVLLLNRIGNAAGRAADARANVAVEGFRKDHFERQAQENTGQTISSQAIAPKVQPVFKIPVLQGETATPCCSAEDEIALLLIIAEL